MTIETNAPLLENRGGKPYFIGDYVPGKRLANTYAYVLLTAGETPSGEPVYIVELYEDEPRTEPIADGSSTVDYEDAWRFALGQWFGTWGTSLDEGMSLPEQLASVAGRFM